MARTVDPVWAREVLGWWVEHVDAALAEGRTGREFSFCRAGPRTDAMLEREDQTRQVIGIVLDLGRVDALVRPLGKNNFVELQSGADLSRRALGVLKTSSETKQHISGTSAPTMAADSLHPLIWNAASTLWLDGHHGAAVQRAATFLNAHVQDLTGRRDVSDSGLMAQVFSGNEPEAGKPRLRWPGEDTDLTVKAMRTGLLQFGQGCFMAIRNPVTHSTTKAVVQESLEQLSVLSTLARWIDGCQLIEIENL